jgi:hypothetical protein
MNGNHQAQEQKTEKILHVFLMTSFISCFAEHKLNVQKAIFAHKQ